MLCKMLFLTAVVCRLGESVGGWPWPVNPSIPVRVYDEGAAETSALYSSAAYCSPSQVKQWRPAENVKCSSIAQFSVKQTFEVRDTFGTLSLPAGFAYIGVDQARKWVVAAFKGSNSTMDWIFDFWGLEFDEPCTLPNASTSLLARQTEGKVHTGFCRYYAALAQQGIASAFLTLLNAHPGYEAVITGHSLGGAVATLFSYDVYDTSHGTVKPLLHTFGQPRVGDYDFSRALLRRVRNAYRIVHRRDVVPHLPLCFGHGECRNISGDPFHFGMEVWYHKEALVGAPYKICDGSGEVRRQSTPNSVPPFIQIPTSEPPSVLRCHSAPHPSSHPPQLSPSPLSTPTPIQSAGLQLLKQ